MPYPPQHLDLYIKRSILFTIIFVAYCLNKADAQKMSDDPLRIDSMTMVSAKAKLNALSIEPFQKASYTDGASVIPYRFMLPEAMHAGEKYPLVITLHNSSRVGDDNVSQLEPLARIWLLSGARSGYKAFVLAPQFKSRSSVYTADSAAGVLTSSPSADVKALYSLTKELEHDHPEIDTRRVYVVGYSMGASTAQNLVAMDPHHFAAVVSIAAVPDMRHADAFKKLPIWLVHGQLDADNPYNGSVALYKAIAGNRSAKFVSYQYLTHNNIMVPFLNAEVIPGWLFKQVKR
ncbi:prolyl oligopeptidase family serine peptidase [Mucilaginibacter daejeonensis]|uniref:carboxylesterase family protein n=1 Tax=Mucilaginibacter daejeonensis TaxID=398049 RepID=UPI001D17BD4F|nr:prolyl oligopeptidase family serine peptidase [Mucilaginibacter daejeonensis]UEG53064.1 prolyl oligopeptidase family serine peptidase [Mucilaginibacter daejeonensis]